jgi:hypothetical protein
MCDTLKLLGGLLYTEDAGIWLENCYREGILNKCLPDVELTTKIKHINSKFHTEATLFEHIKMSLSISSRLISGAGEILSEEDRLCIVLSTLLHDLGKLDVRDGHEHRQQRAIKALISLGVAEEPFLRIIFIIRWHMLLSYPEEFMAWVNANIPEFDDLDKRTMLCLYIVILSDILGMVTQNENDVRDSQRESVYRVINIFASLLGQDEKSLDFEKAGIT